MVLEKLFTFKSKPNKEVFMCFFVYSWQPNYNFTLDWFGVNLQVIK